ncbi:MAG: CsbD family protein [Thiobacillus sp.]|nr:CsbD family protein [Thiobacillus sp.]
MDWNIVEGNWKQFKGKVKTQWGKLTDDHLDVIAGKRDQLAGKIQESYGITKDEAEKQIKDFEERNKGDLS